MHRFLFCALLAAILLGLGPQTSEAQRFSYGADRARTVQSLTFRYSWVDFEYNGDEAAPPISYAFRGPVYGVVFTRPNFYASIAIGNDDRAASAGVPARDRQMLDAALFTWGALSPFPRFAEGRYRLFIPILLHSGYRRVSDINVEEGFDTNFTVTSLGLGAGVGFSGELSERVIVEGRAAPVIALATREFDSGLGSARLFDADVQAHIGPLAGRFGLSVGYGVRAQVWNLRGSDLFENAVADLYDYRGTQHTFRVGVNF